MARGFTLDFGETFAPTVSSSSVRLLSAIAYGLDLDLWHFDVHVQSYLNEEDSLHMPK